MTILSSSIIKLHALHSGQLGHDSGQWANAVFYGLLHQVDPVQAEALHQWNGRKPFTISSLGGLPKGNGPTVELRAGWECWLRVTTLGQEIFRPFIRHFLQGGSRPQIRLGPLTFGVSEVLSTPGSHPWAGYIESDQLLTGSDPVDSLTLDFVSPTVFNLGPRYELFPLPALVFGSLATKWNAYLSPLLNREEIEALAKDKAMISDFRLQTHTQRWQGRIQKGFRGRCTYDLSQISDPHRHFLAALADFALYAGVGGKTTQGMGQCRRIVDGELRSHSTFKWSSPHLP